MLFSYSKCDTWGARLVPRKYGKIRLVATGADRHTEPGVIYLRTTIGVGKNVGSAEKVPLRPCFEWACERLPLRHVCKNTI